MSNSTYKDFSKYLHAVADLYEQYGDEQLELGREFNRLHDKLCNIHNDWTRGAARIESLKDVFVVQCEEYGQGWIDK